MLNDDNTTNTKFLSHYDDYVKSRSNIIDEKRIIEDPNEQFANVFSNPNDNSENEEANYPSMNYIIVNGKKVLKLLNQIREHYATGSYVPENFLINVPKNLKMRIFCFSLPQ